MAQASTVFAVKPADLKAMIDRGEVLLVDVREPAEHAREAIPEAALIPLSKLRPEDVSVANGKRVVLYCASGMRSERAAKVLRDAGCTAAVAHLAGGLSSWKRAGLSTRVDPKAPLPIIRQVQMIAGSLILLGVILGYTIAPAWFLLSGLVGAGLLLAGITGWCGMATLLGRLPYNRV